MMTYSYGAHVRWSRLVEILMTVLLHPLRTFARLYEHDTSRACFLAIRDALLFQYKPREPTTTFKLVLHIP